MLLTSSQVSVAVSSSIVVLCTSALFLSGYVLQQRTLRDLRQALKEPSPPTPKIFLPDRFNKMTTELEDGTVVVLDEEDDVATAGGGQAPVEVEVHASIPGAEDERKQQPISISESGQRQSQGDSSPIEEAVKGGRQQEEPIKGDAKKPRKSKKQEKQEKPEKPEKPVSRAERRRLIKEEIRRLSHNDKPVLYQRRLY